MFAVCENLSWATQTFDRVMDIAILN